HCITEWMHPTGWVVAPGDRHLANLVAPPSGDEQHLDVKRPAVEDLSVEEIPRHAEAKRLEATLGVLDARQGEDANEPVEDPPHQMAVRRLPDAARAWDFARCNRDVHAAG